MPFPLRARNDYVDDHLPAAADAADIWAPSRLVALPAYSLCVFGYFNHRLRINRQILYYVSVRADFGKTASPSLRFVCPTRMAMYSRFTSAFYLGHNNTVAVQPSHKSISVPGPISTSTIAGTAVHSQLPFLSSIVLFSLKLIMTRSLCSLNNLPILRPSGQYLAAKNDQLVFRQRTKCRKRQWIGKTR